MDKGIALQVLRDSLHETGPDEIKLGAASFVVRRTGSGGKWAKQDYLIPMKVEGVL